MRQLLRKIRQAKAFRLYAEPVNSAAKVAALRMLEAAGRYRHYNRPPSRPSGPPVAFEGDNPVTGELSQTRHVVDPATISIETVENVAYTRFGQAWIDGCLMRQYSAKSPSYRDLLGSGGISETLENATIIQSFLALTYGDWMGEHLSSLIYFGCPVQPLALPGFLEERRYVRRDCERLGLDVRFIKQTTRIRNCVVLPKVRQGNYFMRDDPRRFCEAFAVAPRKPRPGSIVYLTRRRASSYGPARRHPFEEISAVMDEIDARIIDTDEMSFDGWLALGEEADIVIAEHGAALFNMMFWRPRCVIELFSGRWWNNSFLFVGEAVGVERHFLFNTDGLDRSAIARRIKSALAAFESGKRLDVVEAAVQDPVSEGLAPLQHAG